MTVVGDDAAAVACADMLKHLGIEGDEETPARFVRALAQLTVGVGVDPCRHLAVTFPPVSPDPGLVVVRVPFVSVCEHHLLPFAGTAAVAWLPVAGGRIVGLSKLARMVKDFAARPQIQERLAAQVVGALTTRLECRGAAVHVRAVHSCMALRGVATGDGGEMVTVDYAGDLLQEPWRGEFSRIACAGGGVP